MTSQQPLQAVAYNHVIAAVYETVIRAELSDQFLRSPTSTQVSFDEVRPIEHRRRAQFTSELRHHFTRAAEILEQQWTRAGSPAPAQFFEDNDRFWILLGASGKMVRASRVAREQLHDAESDIAKALGLVAKEQSRLQQLLARLGQPVGHRSIPEIYVTSRDSRKLMCRMVQCGQGLQATYKVMLEPLDFQWTDGGQEMLSKTFDLHKQELQLLKAYFGGCTVSELAERVRGGEAGIQAQLAGILDKTGAPSLEEMVRLFCFLMAEVVSDEEIANGISTPAAGQLLLDNGQQVHFHKMGAETGQPIIFLHGLLDGIAGIQRLQLQFRKRGFRVYAPLRCGYGQTGPVTSSERRFDTVINQLEALIEQENLRRPILLGHRGGAAFAHVAARRLRDRVSGAVIVSGMAPVQNLSQLSAMRGHQRMMAVTATYCPNFMPLVAKRWEHYVVKNGPMALLKQRPDQGCKESDLIETPELHDLLRASNRFVLDQKSAGLMADYYWIVNDWQRHINGNSAPVIYLHGDQDQVTSARRLQQTMASRNNVQVRLCNGAGSMLLYTRPELVLAALEELADG